MSRLLIVSADDLGLTDGVCRAVARGFAEGVVTSTSLLAVGRAFGSAVRVLRDAPGLDAGAHLAMVGEDPPLLTSREIPTLVNKQGRFPLSYRTVLARGFARRIDPEDVRREFTAQLQRIRAAGVHVSHLDTHQHVHLWPAVGRVVTELARQQGIAAVRTPASHRVLPGGFGTFDELFEALVLVQTHKVTSFPIVLIGTAYWQGLVDWLAGPVVDRGMITKTDLGLINVTDDVAEAVALLVAARDERGDE